MQLEYRVTGMRAMTLERETEREKTKTREHLTIQFMSE